MPGRALIAAPPHVGVLGNILIILKEMEKLLINLSAPGSSASLQARGYVDEIANSPHRYIFI